MATIDPTVAFQRCMQCGSGLRLNVRRYQCRQCGTDVASRFLFDGLVFNKEYFRDKMTESRMRKKEQRECVRKMLAESRSMNLELPAADLSTVPGLKEALDGLTVNLAGLAPWVPQEGFDLKRYESHVQAHIRNFPVSLDELPPLEENSRKDRIWRFIAIIFLAHFGLIDICQDGQTIMVMKRETDREGQDIPGDIEASGGIEGPLGRAEAW